ncbi:MAG: 6,7-dimethyl-8-ribityllumazine synthase [Pirellulales bacterium]
MANVYEGTARMTGHRFAVVVSRYNESITSKLLRGALDTLADKGVEESAIDVASVPGACEIPLVAQRMASSSCYAAILCLGAVIRGETTHDRHICRAVSLTLADLALRADVPILFGLLTCETVEQAIHRAGGGHGNKGSECAEAAVEMVSLLEALPKGRADGTIR